MGFPDTATGMSVGLEALIKSVKVLAITVVVLALIVLGLAIYILVEVT